MAPAYNENVMNVEVTSHVSNKSSILSSVLHGIQDVRLVRGIYPACTQTHINISIKSTPIDCEHLGSSQYHRTSCRRTPSSDQIDWHLRFRCKLLQEVRQWRFMCMCTSISWTWSFRCGCRDWTSSQWLCYWWSGRPWGGHIMWPMRYLPERKI